MRQIFAARLAATTAISLAVAGPALAQTDEDGSVVADQAIEEIVVTGSRLKRDSFNVSTPLVSVDNEAMNDTGLGSLALILLA